MRGGFGRPCGPSRRQFVPSLLPGIASGYALDAATGTGVAISEWLRLVALMAVPLPGYAKSLGPGDTGYMHEELHGVYRTFFGGKCPCTVGECRPTVIRPSAARGSGMDVLVDGVWYPVPEDAIKLRHGIPSELLQFPAHVCARQHYDSGKPTPVIECVVYNGAI
jgi:hypothetical protein